MVVYAPGLLAATAARCVSPVARYAGLAFATLASFHVSIVAGFAAGRAATAGFGLMVFYRDHLRAMFMFACQTLAGIAVFEYAIGVLAATEGGCGGELHPHPDFEASATGLFKVHSIVFGMLAALNAFSVALYIAGLYLSRADKWRDIMALEDSVTFDERVRPCVTTIRSCDADYLTYWTQMTDTAIIKAVPAKASEVFAIVCRDVDANADGKISRTEFSDYMASKNARDAEGKIWSFLTAYSSNPEVPQAEAITEHGLREVFYNLDFMRRRFCLSLLTDCVINTWIVLYLVPPVLGLAIVLSAEAVGYEDAFGTGIDLFKLYIAVVTFLYSNTNENVRFLWMMVSERPYNIGDIMLINGASYTVSHITPGYTFFQGQTSLVLSNTFLFNNSPLINLSTSFLRDVATLHVPLFSSVGTDDVLRLLVEFASENHEIDATKLRCGWESIGTNSKHMCVSWKYTVLMHDRNRYHNLRLAVTDHLVRSIAERVEFRFMQCQVAQGGGYNTSKYSKEED